jgi:hypothetical protein
MIITYCIIDMHIMHIIDMGMHDVGLHDMSECCIGVK